MSRDDYIEVADRLQEFYAKFPDGSLQGSWTWEQSGALIVYRCEAYRTPDDPRPGVGYAQEAVPGKTAFTKGSELMNAETSAWGRAMAALGIATKKGIATGHEVRMAKARQEPPISPPTAWVETPLSKAPQAPDGPDPITEAIATATTTEALDALVEAIKGSENPAKYRGLWSRRHKEVSA
ncbi:MAG: hypothetical protein QM286_03500 [Acidobacteriota bacterium]|nr:hypothetical protein [Acidobacteriota bacterium]